VNPIAPPPPRSSSLRLFLAAALLVALVLLTFGRITTHAWLDYDDLYHVIDNPHLRPIDAHTLPFFWRSQYGNLYVPVAYTVFAAETWATMRLTGNADIDALSPVLFHALDISLHALAAVLILLILRRLGASLSAAVLSAALFALHPLQVESVAWISETRGLLAGVFSLLAILAYLRWAEHKSAHFYVVATVLCALAMLSKPSAVMLPMVVAVLDIWKRSQWASTARALTPWLAMSVAVVLITRALQPGTDIREAAPLWARPLIAGDALTFYIGKLFWPFAMTPDYGRTPAAALAQWWTYIAWIIPLALGTAAAIWARRNPRGRIALVSMGIIGASLLPVLGLATFDHQSISTVADRYMYMAMLGVALFAAMSLSSTGRAVQALGWCVVLALGIRAADQSAIWHDNLALWSHSARVSPRSITTLNNHGRALEKAGRSGEAITAYRELLDIQPDNWLAVSNLAFAELNAGHLEPARILFERVVPHATADARTHIGHGLLLSRLGRTPEAAASFRRAVEIDPRNPDAHANLGLALAQSGDAESAMREYTTALRLRPNFPIALHNLGLLLSDLGRLTESADALTRAAALDASQPATWFRLGDVLARLGKLDDAIAAYQRTLSLAPTDANAANNLGLVYIRKNSIDQAIAAFERAVAADPGHAEARDNLANAQILKQKRK
jgi:Flp pilus assembly protein TadD